jgi:hypothetical protein
MGTKQVVWGILCLFTLFTTTAVLADTIRGSGTATNQSWVASDLKHSHHGKPYWNNKSLDGTSRLEKKQSNVGFYLIDAPTAPLADAPDAVPYWGNSGKSKKKTGGNADLNFCFQSSGFTNSAVLRLEVDPAAYADIDEFGWYDVADPSDKHPIFLGPESPVTNATFTPSAQYGFYLKRGDEATFYTQSKLNPYKDTLHQHFVVFQESAAPGAEVYWIGIENQTRRELKKKEGGLGDYNDMLIRISCQLPPSPVPEPSAAFLVLSGLSILIVPLGARYQRRRP